MPPINHSPTTCKQTEGLLLRRYEIGQVLGHGSFGKVYVARNVKSNELVAIKVIDKEKILKDGLISHIKREISILRHVRHPNIVQLFEVMATKSKIFFVMEYVKGGELFSKVAKGRLNHTKTQLVLQNPFKNKAGVVLWSFQVQTQVSISFLTLKKKKSLLNS